MSALSLGERNRPGRRRVLALALACAISLLVCASAAAGASQTITFTSTAPTMAVAGGSYTVSASSTAGVPVTVLVGGSCSFFPPSAKEERLQPETFEKGRVVRFQPVQIHQSPVTVYFVGAGRCTIAADAIGNSEYAEAHASQSFTVAKNPSERITFTSRPNRQAHVGGSYDPSVRLSERIGVSFSTATPSVCSIDLLRGYVSLLAAGRCVITVKQDGVGKSEPPEARQAFVVHGRRGSRRTEQASPR